jgi:3-deoxy-D-manno-octulosonate 8-phosphate phosphatase (KDO 8-P phosphatase)
VLDIRLARICGLRLQLRHPGSHLFNHFVRTNQAADYTTANEGGKGGLREVCELLIGLNGNYEEVLHARIDYTGDYESYFKLRQSVQSAFFVHHEGQVMPAN